MCGCRFCRGLNDQPTKGCCPNCDNTLIMRRAEEIRARDQADALPGATVTVGGPTKATVYEITEPMLQDALDQAAELGRVQALTQVVMPWPATTPEHAFVVGQILAALRRERLDASPVMEGEEYTDTIIVLGDQGNGFRITVRPA